MISKKKWELSYRSHNSSSLLSHVLLCLFLPTTTYTRGGGEELKTMLPVRENREKWPSYRTVAKLTSRKDPFSMEAAYTASRG